MSRSMMTQRLTAKILLLVMSLVLASCVTVTESRFTKKKSPEKAVENYTKLGIAYLQKGRPDLARARLKKALEIDDGYAPANDAMGLVWQSEGEYDLAEEHFRRALSDDSSFTMARHHLGRLYTQIKQYADAEDALTEAANDRYYENRPGAYNDLALNYYRQSDSDKAINAYTQTLRIAPYNVDALVSISTLLFEAQRYEESMKYFDRFDRMVERKQSQHSSQSLWLGIRLATILGKTQRAIDLAGELKRQFPDSAEYRMYRESLPGANG